MTKRQQAVTYFVGQGWTPAQAAGIVANLEAESSLNPAAVGDGGKAYGIAQWHPDRQAYFSVAIGGDIRGSSFEQQLVFVHAELQTTEKRAGDLLRATTTPGEAGAVVSKRYERPADTEGEASKRAVRAEAIFSEYIREVKTQPAAPIEDRSRPYNPEQESPMLPALIPALLPTIVQMIPALIGIFGKGDRSKVNAAAAQVVADTVVKATEAVNLQEAVEKMASNETVKLAAQAAVLAQPAISTLLEVGGGIEAAAKRNVEAAHLPLWKQPVLWVTLMLLPLIYYVVIMVLSGMAGVTDETKSMVIGFVIGTVLGAIVSYFYGTTSQSAKKDDLIARQT